MSTSMSSRERMLATIAHEETDYTPCSFMIYNALRSRCRDQFEFVERQVAMGLDTCMGLPVRDTTRDRSTSEQADFHGLPVRFRDNVQVQDWRQDEPGARYPTLHRRYATPAGTLMTSVDMTEDWVQGERVPLFDDFVIPRARKRLVVGAGDLPALRCLLTPPTDDEITEFRQTSQRAKETASRLELMTIGEWGGLFDIACWLCGMEELVYAALEQPDFVEELLAIIGEWNRVREEIILDVGVDLFIRRGWYETTDFWSPALYERFILPDLKANVSRCHQAGARLAVISTSSFTPLLDNYIDAGIDVLIGADPVQDVRADLPLTKETLAGKVAIWGGVNGFVTVETGTPDDVRHAVAQAMQILSPGGGFVLSPVDNVVDDSPATRTNVHTFIEAWKELR
jgi:uroporphyrinogen-III decarboxylase